MRNVLTNCDVYDRKYYFVMTSLHDESARLRQKIEIACLHFLINLFSNDSLKRKSVSMTTFVRDESGVEIKNGRLVLRTNQPNPFAAHIQALCQIHQMLLVGQKASKRDLFYECKQLYKVQPTFNRSLSAICKFLGSSRRHLRVFGSSRGFAIGDLMLYNNSDDYVDFRQTATALFDKFMEYKFVQSSAKVLLVVEKDSIFQKLIDEKFTSQFPEAILVTGRGYPDICTREFLYWISAKINVKFLALMDDDPYGIEIFLTYKYGATKENFESGNARIPNISLIGLRASELNTLPISQLHYLPLSTLDVKKCWSVICRLKTITKDCDNLLNEIEIIRNMGYKLELEAVSSISPNFMCFIYLRKKLQQFCQYNSYASI